MRNEQRTAITKLKRLKPKTEKLGKAGLKARIDFVVTVFKNGLIDDVIGYRLYDEFGIGERQLDTCFEMHDGDEVVHGFMAACQEDKALDTLTLNHLGQKNYDAWKAQYDKIEQANGQLSFI